MKHLSIALIVMSIMAGDFAAEAMRLSQRSQHAWAFCDSIALVLAGFWFWHHRDTKGER